MAKTTLEKAVDRQRREEQRAARQAQIRSRASAIVSGAAVVDGFRIMDKESETMLNYILDQYDGNQDNRVNFNIDNIPTAFSESVSLEYEKLQMYGVLSNVISYATGAIITINESGKNYFANKEAAYKRAEIKEKSVFEVQKQQSVSRKKYDVFISHANKDKSEYVDLLNMAVRRLGINIFYDSDVLSWGDNWKQVILDGTANSEFAIIVISNNFFGREWTEKELHEFLLQQNEQGQKIVLPLLYNISLEELKTHYPELCDIQCISTKDFTKEEIVILLAKELLKRYR